MNKALVTLGLVGLITSGLSGMEQGKPKSCCMKTKTNIKNSIDRAVITSCLGKRTFTPMADDEARMLFAQENIKATEKLVTLETDEHLTQVATKAGLSGLALFQTLETPDLICHEAYTGKSITRFKDGTIHHAIGIPTELVNMLDSVHKSPILYGVIEREIARILQAYTRNDTQVLRLKSNLVLTAAYTTGIALSFFSDQLLASLLLIPIGLIEKSYCDEYYEISTEFDCDAKAAELAGTTDNLKATLVQALCPHHQELALQSIDKAVRSEIDSKTLSLAALRIYTLLKLQNELDTEE